MQNSAAAASSPSHQLLDLAFARLQAGDAQTAEHMVVEAVRAKPDNADGWNLAGMTAQAVGQHEVAIERFDAAARLIGAHPVILTYRARSELSLGRRDAALASLTEAVSKPGASADTLSLLAGVLLDLNRRDAAGHVVREGLARFAGQPHLTVLRGRLSALAGDHDAALADYRAAAAAEPTLRDAHRLAAVELFAAKEFEEASGHLAQALDIDETDLESWVNLSTALARCGRSDQARGAARRALALSPGHGPARDAMARALEAASKPAITDQLLDDIAEAFASPREQTGHLVTRTMNILYVQTEFHRLRVALRDRGFNGPLPLEEALPDDRRALLYQLSHPAFGRLFANRSIPCHDTERVLTSLRAAFLTLDEQGQLDAEAARAPECLALLTSLARQAHLNEYIAEATAEESDQLDQMQQRILDRLDSATDVLVAGDWSRITLLAAYRPLADLGADAPLSALAADEQTPASVKAIIAEQILHPREEAGIAPEVESALDDATADIGADAADVSARVQAQYEEHPYPRWTQIQGGGAESAGRRMADVLGVMRAQTGAAREQYRALIAGSGTGAQPIRFALRFPHAEVLAVDLSRPSLAYATRKARELGVDNVRFLQANLLDLPATAPFDEIHCSGVLHHLADPESGLRALVGHLAPFGLMHLAFYSRAARRDIDAARKAFAEARPEFDAASVSLADLQDFRRWIAHDAPPHLRDGLPEWVDFYSASMLRDLMFPAQETTYRISEIASMLRRVGLRFIGFDLAHDPTVQAAFDEAFPGKRDDLEAWEDFESRRPESFRFMYQFWAQRR